MGGKVCIFNQYKVNLIIFFHFGEKQNFPLKHFSCPFNFGGMQTKVLTPLLQLSSDEVFQKQGIAVSGD